MEQEIILEARNITKVYPGGVVANHNVNLQIKKGEIHALVGENGAGKSTLMKMLFGMLAPTEGQIFVDGKEVHFSSSSDAIAAGLGMVHQHFMQVPSMTVAENLILGAEPGTALKVDRKEAVRITTELSDKYNLKVEAKEKVERQKEAEAFDQAEAAEATVDQNLTEITESLEEEDLEERILEEPIDPLIQPRTHYPYYNNEEKTKKKHGWGIGKAAAWLMIGIVQLITLLILIPFGLGEFVFCFGFGLLVFLLFQGAKLWGLTLICLGLIGIFQAIVSGLWRIVRPATKKRPYLIALIASGILTGIGVPLMMIEFSSYEEVPVRQDFPELFQPQTIHLMQTDELDRVYLSFHFDEVVFRENPKLSYGSLQLILPPGNYEQRYNDLPDPPDYEYSKTVNIVSTQEGAGEFRTGLEIFLRGLREGKWYQDDQDYGMGHVLIVEASQPTLSQLTMDENQTVLHINP